MTGRQPITICMYTYIHVMIAEKHSHGEKYVQHLLLTSGCLDLVDIH